MTLSNTKQIDLMINTARTLLTENNTPNTDAIVNDLKAILTSYPTREEATASQPFIDWCAQHTNLIMKG